MCTPFTGTEPGQNTIEEDDEPLPGTSETMIHEQNGTIGERNSYGPDPADRPG